MAGLRRTASVTWFGPAREGRGTFRVGSGALVAPFTYNSRFKGNNQTNPEELLLAAQAGCLTMALAAALREKEAEPVSIETSAELDLVPHAESGGYRIPSMQLDMAHPPRAKRTGRRPPTCHRNVPHLPCAHGHGHQSDRSGRAPVVAGR
jgi:lipoyl-dependent peroxiredoxin